LKKDATKPKGLTAKFFAGNDKKKAIEKPSIEPKENKPPTQP
jgi:hypothetical protein